MASVFTLWITACSPGLADLFILGSGNGHRCVGETPLPSGSRVSRPCCRVPRSCITVSQQARREGPIQWRPWYPEIGLKSQMSTARQ